MCSKNLLPPGTISIEVDELDRCVLLHAEYSSGTGVEKLVTACDRRTDPIIISTLPKKHGDEKILNLPITERADEFAEYVKRTLRFERSADPASDLYRVIPPENMPEEARIEVWNRGGRALRFLMPDGKILRLPAGYRETIWPETQATADYCPTGKVRLSVDATTEMCVTEFEWVDSQWQEIGAVTDNTAELDDYLLRVRGVGGSLLGVIQVTTAYSGSPALSFVDCKRYGADFCIQNIGNRPVQLRFPEDNMVTCTLQPDGTEHPLSELLQKCENGNQ